ncbi:MAG: hypothetical protein E7265_10495 [Lachnospiraceae bacterium]|nr:hypothetical protein [Lachnospiraceae bacterium]
MTLLKILKNRQLFRIILTSFILITGIMISYAGTFDTASDVKAADIRKSAYTNESAVDNKSADILTGLEEKSYLTLEDIKKAELSFTKESYTVIKNNRVSVGLKCNIPDKFLRITYTSEDYYTYFSSYGGGMVTTVTGNSAGTSVIKATVFIDYYDENGMYEGCKTLEATSNVIVIDYIEKELTVGEQYSLNYTQYETYAHMKYEVADSLVATVAENGVVTGVCAGRTSVYITDGISDRIYVGTIVVKSNYISISESNISRAVGSSPYQLSVINTTGGTVTWTSNNNSIATVDSQGMVIPHAVGTTKIVAVHTSLTGFKTTCTCDITVTNPVLSVTETNVAKNNSITLTVNGTTGIAEWSSAKKSIASVYSEVSSYSYSYHDYEDIIPGYNAEEMVEGVQPKASVYGNKKGKCVVKVVVDGITLSCNITVTDPALKKSFFVVTKGMRQTIKVTGINKKSVVKFTSAKPKIASVSKKGIVKAKRIGFAPIKIEVDGAVYVASINVGAKKGVKAVLNALKVEGAKYSQARRMSKGYYDCSSLVWRMYSPLGVTFGDRYYAPVAANQAYYCVSHKKTLPKKYLKNLDKLRPGDLFFFRGSSNGRYKNIYHVAIYMGQEGYGDYTIGKIIHASGVVVSTGYIYNQENIVVIGRP